MNDLRSAWANGERRQSISAGTRAFMVGVAVLSLMIANPASAAAIENKLKHATNTQSSYITSLWLEDGTNRIELLRAGQTLGAVTLRVRTPGAPWREVREGTNGVELSSGFDAHEDALLWEIRVKNTGAEALEIGDLALPLPMNTDYVWDHAETFERRVFRHAFIAGHGSFLYWLPVKGSGPILVMMPQGETHLEFFTAEGMDYAFGKDRFSVFVHSKASAERESRGTWRQSRTSRVLQPGEAFTNRFTFHWADSYDGVREVLYRNGGVDVNVVPGMVVPRDLAALVALRTRQRIERLEPEFPAGTKVEYLGERGTNTHLYRLKFSKLGENRVTLRAAGGWSMPLEFFVTEPLETLIKKRAAFIVKHQQHRDATKWYDGLFSLWDRRQPAGKNLLGPDHLGGQHPYAVSGSDDPANSKCLLVAEKNVAYPDAEEIASLEYFIKHFVWGKHQRTDTETPYPFGIYGSDSWKQNRFTDRDPLDNGISRPGGPSACRMWRTFDYTTYFALYFDLYRIAKQRPDLVKECSTAEYLERAYGTARAYFEVPANIRMEGGWSFTGWVYWQYTVGNFHEKYLLPLIAAYPQYFKLQKFDLKQQPGLPSLAVQVWLTTLLANYDDPAARRALADAAQLTGGYRKLVEDLGLIYADNNNNPRGAEAIWQWVRTIPREIYPGTGITANDWLGGGRSFLVRGHLKNTFNGVPVDKGEYGFGPDARAIIGDRGSENWFMTVVHHEACHDVDAYVRQSPTLQRRWGQVLVMAGGLDMRADPKSGWFSWELTKKYFRERGLWDGDAKTWDAAWKKYWSEGAGAEWAKFGFMRGNISWFYGAPQESLATQGNQFWNSTEGRLEVAIDRWKRGFKSNLSEVLFFMEIWSLGLDKMKFCENDNACRQIFSFAKLRRNAAGYIDRVDLGDRYYEFAVDGQGAVTALVHVPEGK